MDTALELNFNDGAKIVEILGKINTSVTGRK